MLYGGIGSAERRAAGHRGPGTGGAGRPDAPPAQRAVGRAAAAGVDRAVDRAEPGAAAGRRADRRARHRDHRADHGSVLRSAPQRHDHRRRDPRAGRRRLLRPHHPVQGRADHLRRAHPRGRRAAPRRCPGRARATGSRLERRAWPPAAQPSPPSVLRAGAPVLPPAAGAGPRAPAAPERRRAGAIGRQPPQRAAGPAAAGAGGRAAGAFPGQEHLLQAPGGAAGDEQLRRHPALPDAGSSPVSEAADRSGRNEASFEVSRQALAAGQWLALFPEGTSHSDPSCGR